MRIDKRNCPHIDRQIKQSNTGQKEIFLKDKPQIVFVEISGLVMSFTCNSVLIMIRSFRGTRTV